MKCVKGFTLINPSITWDLINVLGFIGNPLTNKQSQQQQQQQRRRGKQKRQQFSSYQKNNDFNSDDIFLNEEDSKDDDNNDDDGDDDDDDDDNDDDDDDEDGDGGNDDEKNNVNVGGEKNKVGELIKVDVIHFSDLYQKIRYLLKIVECYFDFNTEKWKPKEIFLKKKCPDTLEKYEKLIKIMDKNFNKKQLLEYIQKIIIK
eukprot:Anaeramoba_flamelloidesc36099_g1_i1.p1 GENE.c36099_g1_i1~~c36099_g1_i1.p1  ORF type:complete len:202 (+),score=74.59 c36099_g1_i1:152-757(+)